MMLFNCGKKVPNENFPNEEKQITGLFRKMSAMGSYVEELDRTKAQQIIID